MKGSFQKKKTCLRTRSCYSCLEWHLLLCHFFFPNWSDWNFSVRVWAKNSGFLSLSQEEHFIFCSDLFLSATPFPISWSSTTCISFWSEHSVTTHDKLQFDEPIWTSSLAFALNCRSLQDVKCCPREQLGNEMRLELRRLLQEMSALFLCFLTLKTSWVVWACCCFLCTFHFFYFAWCTLAIWCQESRVVFFEVYCWLSREFSNSCNKFKASFSFKVLPNWFIKKIIPIAVSPRVYKRQIDHAQIGASGWGSSFTAACKPTKKKQP